MWEIINLDNMKRIEVGIESAEDARNNAVDYSLNFFSSIWEVFNPETGVRYGIALEGHWYINSELVENERAI